MKLDCADPYNEGGCHSPFDRSVSYSPPGILDLARRRNYAAVHDAYRRYLVRAPDASVYTVPARRLPDPDINWRRPDVFDDIGAENADSELYKGVVEGGR